MKQKAEISLKELDWLLYPTCILPAEIMHLYYTSHIETHELELMYFFHQNKKYAQR